SNRSWIMTVAAGVPIVLTIDLFVKTLNLPHFSQEYQLSTVLYLLLSSILLSDWVISLLMIFLLWRSRRGSVLNKTDSLVTSLIIYTVTTGMVTSILALIILVTSAVMSKAGETYIGFFFLLSRSYFICLITTLNRRNDLRTYHRNVLSGPQSQSMAVGYTSTTEDTAESEQLATLDPVFKFTSLPSPTSYITSDTYLAEGTHPPRDSHYTGSNRGANGSKRFPESPRPQSKTKTRDLERANGYGQIATNWSVAVSRRVYLTCFMLSYGG
ncbi:uncharacterized protein STEHIDRAFT_123065, partial [Stereum hirsutum FP-91666 SS1]|uniref:uncharacterized protein n=1 Tax=Stereum hirsutum (strain FP-91666) TaxID=721885 RepID=UPI000444974E